MTTVERDDTIRSLVPLTRTLARRVQRVVGSADLDDLVGDGSLGLIRAVDTFDAARGATLDAYARTLIVGAMLNGLRKRDPVSERVRRTMRRAEARRFELAQTMGTLPSLASLERGDPNLRRARAAAHRQAPLSLDVPLAGGGGDALASTEDEPGASVARLADRHALGEAIALLPERQRRILALHYTHDLTLHAISSRLHVSPQRVSQLHLRALARLRHSVAP